MSVVATPANGGWFGPVASEQLKLSLHKRMLYGLGQLPGDIIEPPPVEYTSADVNQPGWQGHFPELSKALELGQAVCVVAPADLPPEYGLADAFADAVAGAAEAFSPKVVYSDSDINYPGWQAMNPELVRALAEGRAVHKDTLITPAAPGAEKRPQLNIFGVNVNR